MKISGSYTLPLAQEEAYRRLQDPEVLARTMPGCESLEKTGDGEYRMKMKMVMASLSGAFDGTVKLADQVPPDSFRMVVEGRGKLGFMKGEGLLKLAPGEASGDAAATSVAYEGDVNVGGPMAAVAQRLLDATSKMMIKRFFDKLAAS